VVSIPWLLYLNRIGADWRSMVKAEAPNASEKELSELERVLQEAKKGSLGDFVKELVGVRLLEKFPAEKAGKKIEQVTNIIPIERSYPSPR